MPKGFTKDMLRYICDIATAAQDENVEAGRLASDKLYIALVDDKNTARDYGVPDEFYRNSQGVEIQRALENGFPTKRLGIQYLVEQAISKSRPDEVLSDIGEEQNLLQRAVLFDAIGESEKAQDYALQGIKELLTNLPNQYQVAGSLSNTLVTLVAEAIKIL